MCQPPDRVSDMHTTIMIALAMLRDAFRSRAALHREVLARRRQMAVLKRRRPRPWLRMSDRSFRVVMCRLWPNRRSALVIVEPATVIGRILQTGDRPNRRVPGRSLPVPKSAAFTIGTSVSLLDQCRALSDTRRR